MGRRARGPTGPPGTNGIGQGNYEVGSTPWWSTAKRWYIMYAVGGGQGESTTGNLDGYLRGHHTTFNRTGTVTELAIQVTTAQAGNVRLGIYDCDQASGEPSTLLYDSGNISVATTGQKTVTGVNLAVTAGRLYLVCITGSVANIVITGSTDGPCWMGGIGRTDAALNAADPPTQIRVTFTFGALPASYPQTSVFLDTDNKPLIAYRYAT